MLKPNMTREEFVGAVCGGRYKEQQKEFEEVGLVVEPCTCGEVFCPGWKLERTPEFTFEVFQRRFTK